MNAIETVKNCVTALIQSVSDLSILREWNELNTANADLQTWVMFMTKVEAITKNQQKTTFASFLQERIPFFRPEHNPTIFEDLANRDKSTKLVAGRVQSGKTAVICGLASYLVHVLKMPTIVVVRNYTADYLQLSRKFSRQGMFGHLNMLVHYAKDARVNQILLNEHPALTICLEHQTQLQKVIDAYLFNRVNFCLITDEADSIAYKSKIDKQRILLFNTLRQHASQFIAVTATAFDMLYLDSTLDNQNIYHVPVPANYKGIEHSGFTLKELPKNFDFKMESETPAIWKLSPDMERFYANLVQIPVFQYEQEDEKEVLTHPVICLQKTETEIKKQLQCMGALIRHPIFGKEFVVIAYNGEGVYAYSPRGLDREIPDHEGEMCWGDESTSPYLVDCPVKHFKSLGIGDILQYFKKYSVKDRTTHIVIIAGQMVGRGLNIVSNDYKWHLTHQILRVSETSTCADITQSCRVFGIYSDNIPTTLYCLQKDAMNLKQSHELQKRIFEGADLSQITENMPELCKQIKMFVGHIPRRRTTKKCAEPEWNCVAKEREQYEQVEEEKETRDIMNGTYLLINPSLLRANNVSHYNRIIEYLQSSRQVNKWIPRMKIFKAIAKEVGEENRLNSNTWGWIAQDRSTCVCDQVADENTVGLLFTQLPNREWSIRLNQV
jgi:hypothetical protein